MKKIFISVLLIIYFLIIPSVRADYVLPYPSYMPGNKLYPVSRIIDSVRAWWNWGSIASFRYNLELSDKYLVEAKTLFEYKQYPLAIEALARSNSYFKKIPVSLGHAMQERKDISRLKQKTREASAGHIAVLQKTGDALPAEFLWEPEKKEAENLLLDTLLRDAVGIRMGVADIVDKL